MIYNDYTNDEIINIVKQKIENTIGIPYEDLSKISKKIKKIYSNQISKKNFNNRYKEIYYNKEQPNNISEKFIKRMSILNDLSCIVEKGSNSFYDIALSMCLAHLINWELIDLTLFWNLDIDSKNNKFMTELDYQIYDYYCLLVFIYFKISEKLKQEFKEQFENTKINTYNNEIINIVSRLK